MHITFIVHVFQFAPHGTHACTGKWFKKHPKVRAQVVLATKVGLCSDPADVNAHGLSRHHIMTSVDQSLARLCTTYINLYQVSVGDSVAM